MHWLRRSAKLFILDRRPPNPLAGQPGATADIDVVIPVGPRDIEMLDLTLEGTYTNAGNVRAVYCIAPAQVAVELKRRYRDISVIDEDDVCSRGVRSRLQIFGGRAGWMMQQFITLSTPEITSAEAALVIDADTVLVRPRQFRTGGTILLLTAEEFRRGYYDTLARLWREPLDLPPFSCISHHMCFLRADVLAMRQAIERRWEAPWMESILGCCESGVTPFSEYELYGHWRLRTSPDTTLVRPSRNIARARKPRITFTELTRSVPARIYSVSCHWYL